MLHSFKHNRFRVILLSLLPVLSFAQDYSGRHVNRESDSTIGAFLLLIIVGFGVFLFIHFIASNVGKYSEKRKYRKIQQEKEQRELQREYERNPILYEVKRLEEQLDRNKEPEFLGIGCGCWGAITAFALIFVPAIVLTCS